MSTYTNALKVLSDQDMKRLACVFFHADLSNVDWDAAAADFGSKSGKSFQTMVGASQKKVRDFAAKNSSSSSSDTPATPTKAATKKTPKRKAKAADNVDAVDEGYGELPGPSKTATPRKKAKPAVKKEELAEVEAVVAEQPEEATVAVGEEKGKEQEVGEGEEQEVVVMEGGSEFEEKYEEWLKVNSDQKVQAEE